MLILSPVISVEWNQMFVSTTTGKQDTFMFAGHTQCMYVCACVRTYVCTYSYTYNISIL